ncbi:hypothetical protein NLJ89_g10671 [Agrocybe chaxingu]|uniref:C2H2-type domain-containing protein n=1 Tax=Agrocybe chaxingu TaxID=84603 RepID=A0A9W8JNF0_9AGAR|nr:hypothetical protein NLJ89_g10671 [Agrocybe chaxingu]
MPRSLNPRDIPCPVAGCGRYFTTRGGLSNHSRIHNQQDRVQRGHCSSIQRPPQPEPEPSDVDLIDNVATPASDPPYEDMVIHPLINGRPCKPNGDFFEQGASEQPNHPPEAFSVPNFDPFENQAHFELADLLFRRSQLARSHVRELFQILSAFDLAKGGDGSVPYTNDVDLLETIDSITVGDVQWRSFTITYSGNLEDGDETPWKKEEFLVWYRDPREVLINQLGNADFKSEMDFAPKKVYDNKNRRRYSDFMSGDWAWRQAELLSQEPKFHGSTLCPVILGSDKTTVSVATGQNDYYPLYLSNGLVHNNVRRAHRNAVSLLAFLAIPRTDREHADSDEFRRFRRQLFHASLQEVLQSLHGGMVHPEVVRYADGHYRRTVWCLGPYIADYPEQVLITCIVQGWCPRCTADKNDLDGEGAGPRSHEHTLAVHAAMPNKKDLWDNYGIVSDIMPFTYGFPRANIHELVAPDLLHQIIKGTFKDHLVTWVEEYLVLTYGPSGAEKIMADIDRRIAAAPLFPNLRRFPQGRGFKQWTGDDSKALMKVFLPAIAGHVPAQMIRAISSFMDFCYLVRRPVLDDDDLDRLDEILVRFHGEQVIFEHEGVRPDGISLPRQHSLLHYKILARDFGAPNGLCSSITESKHIKAVKEPWRRSNRYEALGQMLITNQRLDKLAAARIHFKENGLLKQSMFESLVDPPLPPPEADKEDDDGGPVEGQVIMGETVLARKAVPNLARRVHRLSVTLNLPQLPQLISRFLYEQENLDLETPLDDVPIEDCPVYTGKIQVFPSAVATYYAPSDISGVGGMFRERIRSVESWWGGPLRHDCVFIEHNADAPGFRGLFAARVRLLFRIKYKGIKYPCALVTWFSAIGDGPCKDTRMWMVEPDLDAYGEDFIPRHIDHTDSLDAFVAFYVNKYIDHHAYEIAF